MAIPLRKPSLKVVVEFRQEGKNVTMELFFKYSASICFDDLMKQIKAMEAAEEAATPKSNGLERVINGHLPK